MSASCIHHTKCPLRLLNKNGGVVMKTIKIPYYKETIDIHVAEENLKAVITAKMHEYKQKREKKNLLKTLWQTL